MRKITIYWVTKNEDTITRIRKRFGISSYKSINGETPAEINDDDWDLLKETAKRGFIQLREKGD